MLNLVKFLIGFDSELHVVVTKSITAILDTAGPSVLDFEDEGALAGIYANGKLSAYSTKPKKYFYYTLELNPLTGILDGQSRVISYKGGAETHYCPLGANALLTGFVGDGTKGTFCVTLK